MTTKNNFGATNETVKENVAKGMKWMQEANAKLVETQKEQIKKVADLFNSTLSTSKVDGTANLNNAFGTATKGMTELLQKNTEVTTNFFKTAFKPNADFAKLTDKDAFAKEMEKQVATINNQIADLTIINQTNLDTILKQIDATAKNFNPLADQFKKEIEKTIESTKETIETIVGSYSEFTAPSMEANKETMDKLNDQIKSTLKANMKFWSDLFTPAAATSATEVKVESPMVKISAPANTKKQAATSMN